jgi:Winged helix DNA-binding domain
VALVIEAEERRARLAERHLLLPTSRTDEVPAIADAVVALHSSDPVTVYLSALTRMIHPRIEAVEDALYEQHSLIRHHAMRRTLWVATPEVVRQMHAAATRGLLEPERRRTCGLLANSGVQDPERWLAAAEDQVLADLREHGPSTARELGQRVEALRQPLQLAPGKRYAATQSAHTRVLLILCLTGQVVRGRPSSWINGAYRYAAADSWLPGGLGELDPRQAAADLIDRWLRRFGPGTTVDLRWWTGWTAAVVKRALADCGAVEVKIDDGPAWLANDEPLNPRGRGAGALSPPEPQRNIAKPWVAVLPSLDPTIMGWKQRDWYLPEAANEVFDTAGNAGPSLWIDGRVVGAWTQDRDGEIHTHYFERVSASRRRELDERIEELKAWIGDTRFTVRFPGEIHARMLGGRTMPGPGSRRSG